jgi:hypothetical protein
MSINAPPTSGTPAPPVQPPAAPPAEPQLIPLPADLQPLAAEVETFYRELPRLLREGQAQRFAVIHGQRIHGTWDTYRDARQFGNERFPDSSFLTQKIDARFLPILERHFGPLAGAESA